MFLRSMNKLLVCLSLLCCAPAFAAPFTFNFANVESYGNFGDPGNTRFALDVGANTIVTGMAYNVNVTAYDLSFLSELSVGLIGSNPMKLVQITPGFGDDRSGTASYAGMFDLGVNAVQVGADGILRLEFFEDVSDLLFPDGIWNSGTFTFDFAEAPVDPGTGVPEPASTMLIGAGLALLAFTTRRRNTAHSARAA